jgi:uncharacterized repeat protein (TIGR01451 family)
MKSAAALFFGVAICAAGQALAQAKAPAAVQPLQSTIEQRKVVRDAAGAETLVAAENVRPGDVIEYAATFRNTTKQPLAKVEATLPIPANTELIAGSARPAGPSASLDGRAYAAMPLKRTVQRSGAEVQEDVPLREYRALRWPAADLGPERSVTYTARVRVLP